MIQTHFLGFFLCRLIQSGRGDEVVQCIKDISTQARACKQDPVLYALAVCARSNSPGTKQAAYNVLGDVCRIPTHLFQFIKFCEEMSINETGWGRAHRRAINKWYESFSYRNTNNKDPEKLAYLVTKYKRRYGFSHRDIIRLAHTRTRNKAIKIILQYVLGKSMEAADNEESRKVVDFLHAVEQAKQCKSMLEEEKLAELIALNQLSLEHIPTIFLEKSLNVWKALYRQMPMGAMIRNLGKLSKLGIHDSNDFWISIAEERLKDDIALAKAKIHPLTLLIAFKQYNKGSSLKGKLEWQVNLRISKALEDAFYRNTKILLPFEKRCLIAISTGEDMQKCICGSSIKASEAAAAMALSTVEMENVDVILFTNSITEASMAKIDRDDNLSTIEEKIFQITREAGKKSIRQDLSTPFIWAAAKKHRYEAIIVFTDSLTSCGSIHPAEALKQYSQYMSVPNYCLVVVSMTSNKYKIAAPEDTNTLDVVGFDKHTPFIIMDFIEGFRPRPDEDMEVFLHEDDD